MLSTIVFFLVLVVPFVIYLVNAGLASKDNRGIAAGIPKPKRAKTPKKPREARVRTRRATYCGRGFTHLALALVGSSDSCRYCTYLQEVPPQPPAPPDEPGDPAPDPEAVVREAQEIIDRLNK